MWSSGPHRKLCDESLAWREGIFPRKDSRMVPEALKKATDVANGELEQAGEIRVGQAVRFSRPSRGKGCNRGGRILEMYGK